MALSIKHHAPLGPSSTVILPHINDSNLITENGLLEATRITNVATLKNDGLRI